VLKNFRNNLKNLKRATIIGETTAVAHIRAEWSGSQIISECSSRSAALSIRSRKQIGKERGSSGYQGSEGTGLKIAYKMALEKSLVAIKDAASAERGQRPDRSNSERTG
jgi:hypothetical protein